MTLSFAWKGNWASGETVRALRALPQLHLFLLYFSQFHFGFEIVCIYRSDVISKTNEGNRFSWLAISSSDCLSPFFLPLLQYVPFITSMFSSAFTLGSVACWLFCRFSMWEAWNLFHGRYQFDTYSTWTKVISSATLYLLRIYIDPSTLLTNRV